MTDEHSTVSYIKGIVGVCLTCMASLFCVVAKAYQVAHCYIPGRRVGREASQRRRCTEKLSGQPKSFCRSQSFTVCQHPGSIRMTKPIQPASADEPWVMWACDGGLWESDSDEIGGSGVKGKFERKQEDKRGDNPSLKSNITSRTLSWKRPVTNEWDCLCKRVKRKKTVRTDKDGSWGRLDLQWVFNRLKGPEHGRRVVI